MRIYTVRYKATEFDGTYSYLAAMDDLECPKHHAVRVINLRTVKPHVIVDVVCDTCGGDDGRR